MLHRLQENTLIAAKAGKGNSVVSNINDLLIGGGAATSPLWLTELVGWSQDFLIIGGALLLLIRIILAFRTAWRVMSGKDTTAKIEE